MNDLQYCMHHDQSTWDEYDIRGIYLTKVCDICVHAKLAPYNEQLSIMRCALADLIGAWESYTQMDIHSHDWKTHVVTITELADLLGEELPLALTGDDS